MKIFILLIFLVLSACSQDSITMKIQRAEKHINNKDYQSSIIDLKNIIQEAPKDAQARYLLGLSYLHLGLPESSIKELEKAILFNFKLAQSYPLLTQALTQLEDNTAIIEIYNTNNEYLTPQSRILVSLAYLRLGQKEEGIALFKDISSKNIIISSVANAFLKLEADNIENAIVLLSKSIKDNTNILPEIEVELANLYFQIGDYKQAAYHYKSYYQKRPNLHYIQLYIAHSLMNADQYKEADTYLDKILSISSNHSFANFLKSSVKMHFKEYKNAQVYAQAAISFGYDNINSRLNAGIASYLINEYETAYSHFSRISSDIPEEHVGKSFYYSTLLQLGYTDKINEATYNIDNIEDINADILLNTSFNLVNVGDVESAKSILEKTKHLKKSDPMILTKKAMINIALNDKTGIDDIEKAIEISPNNTYLKLALIYSYYKANQTEVAISKLQNYLLEHPKDINALNFSAIIHHKKNDLVQAEYFYEKSLEILSTNQPSLMYFANKAFNADDMAKGLSYLKKVLSHNPNYVSALSKGFIESKNPEQINNWISYELSLLNKEPDLLSLRLEVAKQLLKTNKYRQALELLKYIKINSKLPEVFWIQYTTTLLAHNNSEKALDLVDKWIKLSPKNKKARIQKILILDAKQQFELALNETNRAALVFSNAVEFEIMEASLLIKIGQPNEAMKKFNSLSEEIKSSTFADDFRGKFHLAKKEFKKAIPYLKNIYKIQPSSRNLSKLYRAIKLGDSSEAAILFLNNHLSKNTSDDFTRTLLAGELVTTKPKLAIKHYKELLKTNPQSSVILNNLSWLLMEHGDLKAAKTYIDRGLKSSPSNEQLLDTSAMISIAMKDFKSAETAYKRAIQNGKNPEIKFNYAQLLVNQNRYQEAKIIISNINNPSEDLQIKIKRLFAQH
jgi:putative PEP-CTERM system TPR-repeat lipoprotein